MNKPWNLSQHIARSIINAEDHGAVGDGVTDDYAAITAALAKAAAGGGGSWVFLPPSVGGYRITQGLKLPSYVGICGGSPSRYPFAAGAPNVSQIVADFADPNQWVIEPDTRSGGAAVGYNTILTTLPDGATYNCAVKDLIVTSVGTLPFGGIRMHGCPGSTVRDVAVNRVGCGLLVSMCFGGEYTVNCLTAYYGVVSWGQANASKIDAYCARDFAYTGVVPASYVMSFLAAISTILTTTYSLSTNTHYNRAWGVIIGSDAGSTVQGTCADLLAERFSGGLLMLNAGSTVINRLYVEGDPNVVHTAVAASHGGFQLGGLHAYQSGTGQVIDMGDSLNGEICFTGIINVNALGKLPKLDTTSILTLRGIGPAFAGAGGVAAVNQWNVNYPDKDGQWITPAFNPPVTNLGGVSEDFGYRITRTGMVEMKGWLNNLPAPPFVAFILPVGFRPNRVNYFNAINDGSWVVEPNGNVSNNVGSPTLNGNEVRFQQAQ